MSSFPIIRNLRYHRDGFTLVELLLVMAIIAVLASLALAVIGDSQYNAQRNATQSRVNQISAVLEETMEEYAVLRPPIDDIENYLDSNNDDVIRDGRSLARQIARRVMLDIINFEMPRGYESVALNNNNGGGDETFPSQQLVQWIENQEYIVPDSNNDTLVQTLQTSVTFKSDRFRIPNAPESAYPHGNESNPTSPSAVIRTSSEFLYAILEQTQSQGILAIESLSQRAFDDTDDDGFLEVVDSWGNPIGFYFEMYDDNGSLLNPTLLPSPASLEADLDAGFESMDDPSPQYPTAHFGTPARNIRIRIYSTGNKPVDDFGVIGSFFDWFVFINNVDTLVSN